MLALHDDGCANVWCHVDRYRISGDILVQI